MNEKEIESDDGDNFFDDISFDVVEETEAELCTPPEIREIAKNVSDNLIPDASRQRYEHTYKLFTDWQKKMKTKSFSENTFLAYFSHLAESLASTTLWARYSMIKSMVKIKENIDISDYNQLKAFLKRKNVGHRSKQSKTFQAEEIERFLKDAPNETFLIHKVSDTFNHYCILYTGTLIIPTRKNNSK